MTNESKVIIEQEYDYFRDTFTFTILKVTNDDKLLFEELDKFELTGADIKKDYGINGTFKNAQEELFEIWGVKEIGFTPFI